MWKIIKWLVILSVVAGAGWFAYQWQRDPGVASSNAFAFVPADAVFCITTDDPIAAWRKVSDSHTWGHLQGNAYFASIGSSINHIDSLMRENPLLFELIGSRSLVMSAHMTGLKQYEFLFMVDLGEAAGITFLNEYVADFGASGYQVSRETWNGVDLITVRNSSDKSNLYIGFPGRFLVTSYNRSILINSLRAAADTAVLARGKFSKERVPDLDDGLMRIYIDYAQLPKFVGSYSNDGREYLGELGKSLGTTVLNVTFQDDLLKAHGRTSVIDTMPSYVRALTTSGDGPTEFVSIAPQRTAFAFALGFESFGNFFSAFENNLRRDIGEYETYEASLEQVENYLDIDLREDFIGWIGDEVAVIEMESTVGEKALETALVLKAQNIEVARDRLAHIEKMLKRKTPVKFKTVSYRGYQINYLSMKGMFRVLFGKFFARYDKPYFTIVNNFVIFSNHPQTLEGIIDDYLEDNTLGRSDEFLAFRREFANEGAAFVYANTPALFETMKELADEEVRAAMEENRDYIVSFRHVGFQLVPDGDGFFTTLAEQFNAVTADENLSTTPFTVTAVDESTTNEVDPMALPGIYIDDLNASTHTSWYNDSTVHYSVGVRNGFKDGPYVEYYPDGIMKLKGHFRMGKREGTWRLFDEDGELLLKRVYHLDRIRKEKN